MTRPSLGWKPKCSPFPKDHGVSPTKEKSPFTFVLNAPLPEVKSPLRPSTAWQLDGVGALMETCRSKTVCLTRRGLARLAASMRCSWPRSIRSEIRENAVGKNVPESHRVRRRGLAVQLPSETGLRMQHTTVSRSREHALNTSETDGSTDSHGPAKV